MVKKSTCMFSAVGWKHLIVVVAPEVQKTMSGNSVVSS